MSYLPGPLTRTQISTLMEDRKATSTPDSGAESGSPGARDERRDGASGAAASIDAGQQGSEAGKQQSLSDNESAVAPATADGISVNYIDPAAPWLRDVGGDPDGTRLVAGVATRVHLLFDDTKGDLRHEVEWEAIIHPIDDDIDVDAAIEVDYDERDLRDEPLTEGAIFVLPDAKIKNKTLFSKAQTKLKDKLYRTEALELFANAELKLYSRVGESRDDFETRCSAAASDRADADVAKLRTTLEKKMDRVRIAIDKSEDRIRELEQDADARGKNQVLDIGASVLGAVLGGRRSTRSILGGARRASSSQRMKTNAKERLATAENRLNEHVDSLDQLETDLTDSLWDIQSDWDERAKNIESLDVPLEKTDISVDEFTLVWIPTK